MHSTLHISNDLSRAIMLRSFHQRNSARVKTKPTNSTRKQAIYGTKAYWDGLQRAFNKAKMQIYFNPDMSNFITLTYAENMQDIDQAMHDVKMLIKRTTRLSPAGSGRTTPKYIYVFEYQKRGAIHVHMIANDAFLLQVNANGYKELVHWPKGFSSVLSINDFDNNFRPYLYLFKYMKKSQRIGKSFVHSSRNLTNYHEVGDASIDLNQWDTKNQEYTHTTVETTNFHYFKTYMQRATINPQLKANPTKGELDKWQINLTLHSNQALENLLANHTPYSKYKSEHGKKHTSQQLSKKITSLNTSKMVVNLSLL